MLAFLGFSRLTDTHFAHRKAAIALSSKFVFLLILIFTCSPPPFQLKLTTVLPGGSKVLGLAQILLYLFSPCFESLKNGIKYYIKRSAEVIKSALKSCSSEMMLNCGAMRRLFIIYKRALLQILKADFIPYCKTKNIKSRTQARFWIKNINFQVW